MDVSRNKSRIIVTCLKRLTPWVEKEISDLGFKPLRSFSTGVELHGTVNDCIRLNLNLRCASQVLYLLREFPARHPDDVYRYVKEFPWEVAIEPDGYFSVTSNVWQDSITNNLFVNVRIKDAIADRFREKTGKRPDSGAELNGVVVHLYWKDNRALLFLDTTGPSMARHGYRKQPGKAPMLEALAAATILAGKWNRRTPFINPMCGSGTLAIEAALLATQRKPGLLRSSYAFQHIVGYDPACYEEELRKLKNEVADFAPEIIASDIRPEAVAEARANAKRAEVEHLIRFEVCDFPDTTVPSGGNGVVYFNPEYGERLGEIKELETTYKRIGDFLKQKCTGYTGYVFTANPELAKKIGLRSSRKTEFYSAQLDCRLMEYELYAGRKT
ncbi:MAG: THUMP domain-containing protein [Cyclobacteriaceae bacterium]|nr:THUMP domain-containing protein [Cyclobacteriaceae bacterium]MDW8332218.1 THUMP domain-containing protein [Cyclobacteriaceae bacterium]